MKKVILIVSLLMMLGCGKKDPAPRWTESQLNEATQGCVEQLTAAPATANESEAKSYCQCYFEKAKSKCTFEEYANNPAKIDEMLSKEGSVKQCLTASGL